MRGEKLDSRTDLFSFGLVLFEIATGHRAFGGETQAIVKEAILHQALPAARELNPNLPAQLEGIIRKALEKNRELRYQTAAEMRSDLKSTMISLAPEARLQTATSVSSDFSSPSGQVPFAGIGDQDGKRRLWIAAGMFAVLLVAAAVSMGPKPLFSRLLNRNSPPVITSIAVVPLDNLSGQSEQDYFADGMTDELITMLAKNSTLRIISRTSVMQYKGVRRLAGDSPRAWSRRYS